MSINEPGWLAGRALAIAGDPEFALSARHVSFQCLLQAGDHRYLVAVSDSEVKVQEDADPALCDFAVRGSADDWDRFIDYAGDLEYRDCLGMVFQGTMSVTGAVENRLAFAGDERKLYANLLPLYVFLSKLQEP